MSRRAQFIAYAFVALAPIVALIPPGHVAIDWIRMTRVAPASGFEPIERGYDWVEWSEHDGLIRADYVFPKGPASDAGLREGDVFHELNFQQYFTAEDLKQAIAGVRPGSTAVYTVMQGDQLLQLDVRFSRDPTFLYPLSSRLWQFSLWGFSIGAFLHVLGLTIVTPLAARSRKARFSLVLIAVSSLWIVGNLLRLVLVAIEGPPISSGGPYDITFQTLTLAGLAGWLSFPALLLHKVVLDARLIRSGHLRLAAIPLYLPAALLAGAAIMATVAGRVGPLTLNALATSILFFACTYIAAAAALMFIVYLMRPERAEDVLGRWNRTGSIVTLVLSVVVALAVLGVVWMVPAVSDLTAGWLIVIAQLLSVAPVVLVTHATLQHGKVDLIVSRGIVYLALLGLFFFAFVGGTQVMEPYLRDTGAAVHVVSGLYVIALLLLFGRLARTVDVYASNLLTSDRLRARRVMAGFADRMRTLLEPESLARESAQTLAEAFDARSVAVYMRPSGGDGPFVSGSYHPEPPFITPRFVNLIWQHVQECGVWTRNSELGGERVPAEIAPLLVSRGLALAVAVRNDEGPAAVVLVGEKRRRRAVFNLEDVELLKAFAAQLGLALERLALVEREKALVRESAEAHLVALRAQINPHFLFNALNTIAALIGEQPREAEETVERVASIFRHTLHAGSKDFVPLEDELDLVTQYLLIEKARFGDRLQIQMDVEEGLAAQPVPAFCIQTLAENAVKHGLEKARKGGSITIRCSRADDRMVMDVIDTGVGIPQLFNGSVTDTSFYGVGLKNISARFGMLFGDSGGLTITSRAGEGTTARLTLPLESGSLASARPPLRPATSIPSPN
ncbi:MAG TPA: histidine kinase [Rhodothermales bacterium]